MDPRLAASILAVLAGSPAGAADKPLAYQSMPAAPPAGLLGKQANVPLPPTRPVVRHFPNRTYAWEVDDPDSHGDPMMVTRDETLSSYGKGITITPPSYYSVGDRYNEWLNNGHN
jgi:hypothetical protein